MRGHVGEGGLAPEHEASPVATRVTIGRNHGCERLEQRLVRLAPGSAVTDSDALRDEVAYVVAGTGRVNLLGRDRPLAPGTALHAAAGEHYELVNDGPEHLELVSVRFPSGPDGGHARTAARRVTVRASDQPVERTGDRTFRVLLDPSTGCAGVTQFVGSIPPGQAAPHRHPYDEVLHVLEGAGVAHLGADDFPVAPGSCLYLPPGLEHCLENTGETTMRVLGVFHPARSPAMKVEVGGR